MEEEEFELVPLNPIRRMEKRVDRLEKSGLSTEMIKELVDVVKTNQEVVDSIVKVNSEMINKVSELSANVSQLVAKMNDFMSRIEVVSEGKEGTPEEVKTVASDEYNKRLDKLEKRINALLLSSMAKTRMRPPQPAKF
jgi:division protein CdvB (Snf7/Vps24/ESCRT-III family)